MVAQPLRFAALACAYALATAVLVLVTVLASNLVLTTVAGLGPTTAVGTAPEPPATAVLLSTAPDQQEGRAKQRCQHLRKPEVRGPTGLLDRCNERRDDSAERRP